MRVWAFEKVVCAVGGMAKKVDWLLAGAWKEADERRAMLAGKYITGKTVGEKRKSETAGCLEAHLNWKRSDGNLESGRG